MNPGGLDDTIAAISTPLGIGGIGIIRMSGPRAEAIAKRLFRRRQETGPLLSHHFYLGTIIHPEAPEVLDEVLLVLMRKPKTYTREDIVEIHCHSGAFILREILQAVLRCGARLAEPGEFTKRAFLNGRIDLAQAEAVIDLIEAKTQRSLELAHQQHSGRLTTELRSIQDGLLDLLALLEAHIDFPDEDIPEPSSHELTRRILSLRDRLDGLIQTYREGKIYRDGVTTVIVGKPNVGKSSLLNALLREERAIVTPIPGTTRDVLEEGLIIQGIPLRLMDTAGLRKAKDAIEEEGVRRTQDRLRMADLALWVVDGSEPLAKEDLDILEQVRSKKTVVAVNKNDLPPRVSPADLKRQIPDAPVVSISALRGSGIDELRETIQALLLDGQIESSSEVILTNVRHKQALELSREALTEALNQEPPPFAPELIVLDIRRALQAVEEIVGATPSEEVLERIFSRFCIGK